MSQKFMKGLHSIKSVLQIKVFQLVSNHKADLWAFELCKRHAENHLRSMSALDGGCKKLWCFYCVYSHNMNNTKKAFRNSEVIQYLFWIHTRAKPTKKILLQLLRKKKTAVVSLTSFIRNKGISKVVFKSM